MKLMKVLTILLKQGEKKFNLPKSTNRIDTRANPWKLKLKNWEVLRFIWILHLLKKNFNGHSDFSEYCESSAACQCISLQILADFSMILSYVHNSWISRWRTFRIFWIFRRRFKVKRMRRSGCQRSIGWRRRTHWLRNVGGAGWLQRVRWVN